MVQNYVSKSDEPFLHTVLRALKFCCIYSVTIVYSCVSSNIRYVHNRTYDPWYSRCWPSQLKHKGVNTHRISRFIWLSDCVTAKCSLPFLDRKAYLILTTIMGGWCVGVVRPSQYQCHRSVFKIEFLCVWVRNILIFFFT
jgi:hypothetical protein